MSWELFYKVSFIFVETDLHLWSLSDCKKNIAMTVATLKKITDTLYTFLEFYTQVFKGFKYYVFLKKYKQCIFDEYRHL